MIEFELNPAETDDERTSGLNAIMQQAILLIKMEIREKIRQEILELVIKLVEKNIKSDICEDFFTFYQLAMKNIAILEEEE